MGRYQRIKGKRNEYALVNELRRLGWVSNRVPLSGAAPGFKGDVVAAKDGFNFTFEVKSRKDEYKKIYELFRQHSEEGELRLHDNKTGRSLIVTKEFKHADPVNKAYNTEDFFASGYRPTVRKLFSIHKLKGECDFLVIKNDRENFLFLRYI